LDGSTGLAAPAQAAPLEEATFASPMALPDPLGIEVLAINSILVDLVQIMGGIAPSLVDKPLSIARLRLQMLDRGAPEVVHGERMVQEQKIRILERALGRTPTVG